MKAQEIEENARDEDTNVENVDVTCNKFLENLVTIVDECSIATSICEL